ncbi:MAG: ABC transporter ATP-binding protein, partial [Methanomassiliicoccaceae archaeon]|nr:ABC transporter ATP-binding protein [Methanomassiliicoccaceae archaeon]
MSKETHGQQRAPANGPMAGRGGPAERSKDFKGTWGKLIRYSRAHMVIVAVALIMASVGAVFQVLGPDRLKQITEEVLHFTVGAPIDMSFVTSVAMILVFLYASSAVLTFLMNWIMATVSQKIAKQMRSDISDKINRLPFSYFNKNSYGDVLSRVTNDADTIGTTLNQSIGILASAVTLFIGSLIMMIYTNLIMAVTAVVTSLAGFIAMIIIMKRSQKYFVIQQKELGSMNGHVEETYTNHNVVKVYNGSRELKKTFEEINEKLYTSGWRSQFFSGLMMPLMIFIGNFGYVAVCIVGAVLAVQGTISFAVIVAFMVYIRLFTQPLSQIAQAAINMQRTAAASERVFEFLEEKELEDEGQKVKQLENVKGNIEFRNVRFGYTSDKIVINDFSASVRAGQKIAIVGPTGAGKTTMVNLLMRFYEIEGGEITIDGTPINEVPRESVHEQFCMVLQDTWLFEGTIKENIAYSRTNVLDAEVVDACKMVGLHHFIQTLPDG